MSQLEIDFGVYIYAIIWKKGLIHKAYISLDLQMLYLLEYFPEWFRLDQEQETID